MRALTVAMIFLSALSGCKTTPTHSGVSEGPKPPPQPEFNYNIELKASNDNKKLLIHIETTERYERRCRLNVTDQINGSPIAPNSDQLGSIRLTVSLSDLTQCTRSNTPGPGTHFATKEFDLGALAGGQFELLVNGQKFGTIKVNQNSFTYSETFNVDQVLICGPTVANRFFPARKLERLEIDYTKNLANIYEHSPRINAPDTLPIYKLAKITKVGEVPPSSLTIEGVDVVHDRCFTRETKLTYQLKLTDDQKFYEGTSIVDHDEFARQRCPIRPLIPAQPPVPVAVRCELVNP